jgi:hypothetical protein
MLVLAGDDERLDSMRSRGRLGIQPQHRGQAKCGRMEFHIGSDEKNDTRILRQSKDTTHNQLFSFRAAPADSSRFEPRKKLVNVP